MLRTRDYSGCEPRETAQVSAIGIADVACDETLALVKAWKRWRGWHAMPSYRAWLEAELAGAVAHASIAKVVDGGRDYMFEFIGDAHVSAYGVNHQGRHVSDIAQLSPRFGRQLKASYDLVRISGHPYAFQGAIDAERMGSRFVWFETAYLPLGEHGEVGHILNAAVYRPRGDAV